MVSLVSYYIGNTWSNIADYNRLNHSTNIYKSVLYVYFGEIKLTISPSYKLNQLEVLLLNYLIV